MKEIEKMLNGEYYNPSDHELLFLRNQTKNKILKFNNLNRDSEEYYLTLKSIIGHLGKKAWIEAPFYCDYGRNIYLGDNFYANTNLTILDCGKVIIGNNVMLGPNVSLYTVNHPMNKNERRTLKEKTKPITIEDDVWLGGNVTILAGITIKEGSVIGAGSVVTKDIPANVFAAGNPCTIIKENINQ